MITKLFSRRAKDGLPAARVPEGRRFYAIGDIHGRLDLLDRLLDRIGEDERRRGGPRGELIFLGDLIDRGPDSAGVVERLIARRQARPETRFLLGNHEEVFLQALDGDAKALRFFTRIGGAETILSYGIAPEAYRTAGFDELAVMLDAAVPASHRDFLRAFEDMIVEGDYAFVHAGVRPGVGLAEQLPSDLRWIRDDFLSVAGGFGKIVVYGHTIVDAVEERPNRIGLDTGAYRSGILTAMGFEADERWILEARSVAAALA